MLLMKDPSLQTPAPEGAWTIAHGAAAAVPVACGQLLTVTDVEGGRSAQLFAFTRDSLREFLSPHHTRVFTNTYVLTLGMRLVSNQRRPLMVLGKDSVRTHDLLTPAATAESLAEAGIDGPGCRETIEAAIAAQGLEPVKIPDPVNLFLHVRIRQDGSLNPKPSLSPAGGSVTFRVVRDCHVFVTACSSDLGIDPGRGPVTVRVHNRL